ncbi:MAG: hypothetical protein AAGI07_00345 [Bacteroidota bacterium]
MKLNKRWRGFLVVTGTIFFGIVVWGLIQLWDRHPGYWVDIEIKGEQKAVIHAGFAAVSINPPLTDTWQDVNNDAEFHEEEGDTYTDVNGNGQFDPFWIAGFGKYRAANGIHDTLWARAMVLDDGNTKIALVSIDAIGFGSDDIISARKMIPESAGIDYTIVTSTHTHEVPDLLGLWGPGFFKSGINQDYIQLVREKIAEAATQAAEKAKPVKIRLAQDLIGSKDLVGDTRKPIVLDPGLYLLQAIDTATDQSLGTLVGWANHPETLWNKNLLVSSDFPHYVREYMEKGIYDSKDSVLVKGLGGTVVYVNGAIGGLMTTTPRMTINDPFTGKVYKEASFEKIDIQGKALAKLAIAALDSTAEEIQEATISLVAKSLALKLDNPLFRLAAFTGVLDRGMVGWMKMRSEVAAWQLGPASFIHVPGEIYPEIVNGGIEAPEGQDFEIQPLEIPPLRDKMTGRYKFVVGLSNDMIGYIIPKSEWDEEAPHIYGEDSSPYGEINSVGPETAPIIHQAVLDCLERLGQ